MNKQGGVTIDWQSKKRNTASDTQPIVLGRTKPPFIMSTEFITSTAMNVWNKNV